MDEAGLETLVSCGSSLMWRGPDQFSLPEGLLFQRVTLPMMEDVARNQMSTAMGL